MGRILNFPEPLPDEDFRSIIFRYHVRSPNVEFYESRLELFGVRSYKQTVFPKRLKYLLEKLPAGHAFTTYELLFKHTWYGLYKAFLTSERNINMRHIIDNGSKTQRNPKGQPTIGEQSVISSNIKYCPICMDEDEKKYGEVYVHRLHQISFLEACPRHSLRLMSKCPVCKVDYCDTNKGILLQKAVCKYGHKMPIEYIGKDKIIRLQFSLLDELIFLRDSHDELSISLIHQKLLEQLFIKKYINVTGIIKKKDIISDFNEFYSSEKLDQIYSSPQSVYFHNQILNQETMVNFILFYLLLARFLCGSFQNLLNINSPIAVQIPFGIGPWACQNVNCKEYDVPLINNCKRKRINGLRGLYSIQYLCKRCKMLTIKSGNPKKTSISINQNKNIEQMYDNTGLTEIILTQQLISATSEIQTVKDVRRKKMLEILTQENFQNRSEIRSVNECLYKWLSKNDNDWLESRIPDKIDLHAIKLDIHAMDQELLHKISVAGAKIDINYHLPIKIGTILKLLDAKDRNHFRHYSHDLPLSLQEISKFVESKTQFLIRSIPRNYQKLLERGITRMTVLGFKRSSVTYYLNGDEEVDNHIHMFLKEKGALI